MSQDRCRCNNSGTIFGISNFLLNFCGQSLSMFLSTLTLHVTSCILIGRFISQISCFSQLSILCCMKAFLINHFTLCGYKTHGLNSLNHISVVVCSAVRLIVAGTSLQLDLPRWLIRVEQAPRYIFRKVVSFGKQSKIFCTYNVLCRQIKGLLHK